MSRAFERRRGVNATQSLDLRQLAITVNLPGSCGDGLTLSMAAFHRGSVSVDGGKPGVFRRHVRSTVIPPSTHCLPHQQPLAQSPTPRTTGRARRQRRPRIAIQQSDGEEWSARATWSPFVSVTAKPGRTPSLSGQARLCREPRSWVGTGQHGRRHLRVELVPLKSPETTRQRCHLPQVAHLHARMPSPVRPCTGRKPRGGVHLVGSHQPLKLAPHLRHEHILKVAPGHALHRDHVSPCIGLTIPRQTNA
eukprot:1219946-Rhodomonas_salina.3